MSNFSWYPLFIALWTFVFYSGSLELIIVVKFNPQIFKAPIFKETDFENLVSDKFSFYNDRLQSES